MIARLFSAEDDRTAWRSSQQQGTLEPEYLQYLHAAAQGLSARLGGSSGLHHALVINLGPSWPNAEASRTFGDAIPELKNIAWERPPGMGICPLDTLFSACALIHRWLTLQTDNIVVSSLPVQATRCKGDKWHGFLRVALPTAG